MTKSSPPLILLDMDNVAVMFEEGVYRDLILDYPHVTLPPMAERTDYFLDKEVDPEHLQHVRDVMNRPGFFMSLEPTPGTKEALQGMLDLGWDVRLCTVPLFDNPTCASDKFAWAEEYIGPGWADRTIITRDKGYVRGDILVDDKPKIETRLKPTWTHVMFDQPYNQSVITKHRMVGLGSWRETIEPILSIQQKVQVRSNHGNRTSRTPIH